MKRLAVLGVSNMLSDIFDCALALGCAEFRIVVNTEEVLRPRTRSFRDRVAELPTRVRAQVCRFEEFTPEPGFAFFLGTTAPGRYRLWLETRARWQVPLCNLVHPAAHVSPLAFLAEGVFVGAGSVVAASATLHQCAFVNRAASVGHDAVVGPFARIQPGAHVGGHVRVGAFATVGLGARVIEEIEVGDRALVAAGAVVTRDVPAGHVAAGGRSLARSPQADDQELPAWRDLAPALPTPTRVNDGRTLPAQG
jgi:carbonic anhydrase/acetyltransferase-like protein (isoleucine patch superfamily)